MNKKEVRLPAVAGQFYEARPESLEKQIISCFLHKLGPGKIPEKKPKKRGFVGAIVPHAGYMFSGPCASNVYFELASYLPKTIILLGPNHTGTYSAEFSVSFADFKTPFGIVKNNEKFGKEICKSTLAKWDESAHSGEHCIEVQLPFLQFIYKNFSFSIVPILVSTSSYELCKEFASQLAALLKKKESIMLICSSDFTHFGFHYGFTPFIPDENLGKNLEKFDKKAIEEILKLDSEAFYKKATKMTICGAAPIVVTIEICKVFRKKPELLKYYTSFEIMKSNSAVGYASIIFK